MIQEFAIDGDKLTIGHAGTPVQVMVRVGTPYPGAQPIVGDWNFTHDTGQPAVARYSRAAIAQLSVRFKTYNGSYRVAGATLHIEFDGLAPLALSIRRDGDLLTTTDANGKEIRFVKFNH